MRKLVALFGWVFALLVLVAAPCEANDVLDVTEWGIRYTIPNEINEIKYIINGDQLRIFGRLNDDTAGMSNKCYNNLDGGYSSPVLVRGRTLVDVAPHCKGITDFNKCNGFVDKIGDYYYFLRGPQAVNCEDINDREIEGKLIILLLEMLKHPIQITPIQAPSSPVAPIQTTEKTTLPITGARENTIALVVAGAVIIGVAVYGLFKQIQI